WRGDEGMSGVVIAVLAGIEPKTVCFFRIGWLADVAQVLGVVVAAPDEKAFAALLRRQQHFVDVGDGAVVQERRRSPYAFQRARFVSGDLLRKIENAKAFVALL